MSEDFGWSGDEFLMGDCMDDWTMDLIDLGADRYEEEMRARDELALEFADEKGERDEGGEYGECSWEDEEE
jgi:hypothetical protein